MGCSSSNTLEGKQGLNKEKEENNVSNFISIDNEANKSNNDRVIKQKNKNKNEGNSKDNKQFDFVPSEGNSINDGEKDNNNEDDYYKNNQNTKGFYRESVIVDKSLQIKNKFTNESINKVDEKNEN